jgi:hypothetical protein
MNTLDDHLRFIELPNAAALASDLFHECFGVPFPVPRDNCGLPIPTPPENWHQFVGLYRWPDGAEETVSFCNWIRHGDVYLGGGMCVKKNFYRRLPKDHYRECAARGGLAQMIQAAAAARLTDCKAWFGYCGDPKALAVDLRFGYELTDHPMLIVKWLQPVAAEEKKRIVDSIARIGPF